MNLPIQYMYVIPESGERRDIKSGDVSLFSTKENVIAIESPIKRMILDMIAQGSIPFDEIVRKTGKAKSTISVHIRDLETSGLVSSDPDPDDQRKRIITLISEPIGKLTNSDRKPAEKQIQDIPTTLPFTEGDIASFFRYTLRVIRTEAMNAGMNTDPILQRAGITIGSVLLPLIAADTLSGKIEKMDAFWQSYGLGTITLITNTPLTLRVDGCFECQDLPVTGHGSCVFDIGVLKTVFAEEFGGYPDVREVECYSSGFDHCTFVITGNEMKDNEKKLSDR